MIIEADKKVFCFELSDGTKWEIPCAQSLPYPFIRAIRKRATNDEDALMDIFDEIIERYAPELFDHIDGGTYGEILRMWAQANQANADAGDADMGESSALSE